MPLTRSLPTQAWTQCAPGSWAVSDASYDQFRDGVKVASTKMKGVHSGELRVGGEVLAGGRVSQKNSDGLHDAFQQHAQLQPHLTRHRLPITRSKICNEIWS